jgi:hypothetical protein
MKKHILSMFDPAHLWWTLSFFLTSVLLIIASQLVGINDNLPGIAMLFVGMIFLIIAISHPWRKSMGYVILTGVCLGIILLIFVVISILMVIGKTEYISEAIVMYLFFFICIPGIVVGIAGAIIYAFIKK